MFTQLDQKTLKNLDITDLELKDETDDEINELNNEKENVIDQILGGEERNDDISAEDDDEHNPEVAAIHAAA